MNLAKQSETVTKKGNSSKAHRALARKSPGFPEHNYTYNMDGGLALLVLHLSSMDLKNEKSFSLESLATESMFCTWQICAQIPFISR